MELEYTDHLNLFTRCCAKLPYPRTEAHTSAASMRPPVLPYLRCSVAISQKSILLIQTHGVAHDVIGEGH